MMIFALCLVLLGAPRDELARWPQPEFTLARGAKLVRWEEREGRREAVLAEASGAGAFVHLRLPEAHGKLRLYSGKAAAATLLPESPELPLAFQGGARLTLECSEEPRFEVAWRSYPAGAQPEPEPAAAPEGELAFTLSLSAHNKQGEFLATEPRLCAGPRAATKILLRVDGPDPSLALRGLVLHLSFDGEETVVCPVATFFAAVESGTRDLVANWVMPYRERMDLRIENLGPTDTHVSGSVHTRAWSWDERSLHFGARGVPARLEIEGRGMWLGIGAGSPEGLDCALDGRPEALREGLALLDRAPFRERLVLEASATPSTSVQRAAFFYLRPGAKITARDSLATDR